MAEPLTTAERSLRFALIIAAFVIPSLCSLGVVGTACWLWSQGRDLPQGLQVVLTASVTYTFTALPLYVNRFLEAKA